MDKEQAESTCEALNQATRAYLVQVMLNAIGVLALEIQEWANADKPDEVRAAENRLMAFVQRMEQLGPMQAACIEFQMRLIEERERALFQARAERGMINGVMLGLN